MSQLRELADSYTSHLPDSSPTNPRLQLCFLPASLSFYGAKTSGGLKRRAQELGDLSLVRLYRQPGKEHSCSQLGSALLFPTWVSPLSLAIFCIAWVCLVQHQGERRNGLPALSLSLFPSFLLESWQARLSLLADAGYRRQVFLCVSVRSKGKTMYEKLSRISWLWRRVLHLSPLDDKNVTGSKFSLDLEADECVCLWLVHGFSVLLCR